MMEPVKVGIVGCGNISPTYLEQLRTFDILEVKAVHDIINERAEAKAAKFNVPHVYNAEQIMGDDEIEIIINLTPPLVHSEIALRALRSGKSAYDEKPLAVFREDGQLMLRIAGERGLRVGGAPDTFMGAGLQTCRKAIDDGLIGRPVAATAFMMGHGPEAWHPDPEFFYKVGGGPLFDMGPYYLTALVSLFGPVKRVTGSTAISFKEREVGSGEKRGKKIVVETPTHVAGLLDFESGPVATLITSFDVWHASLPRIEVYGSEGTLTVPDPNTFGGPVVLWKPGAKEGVELPLLPLRARNSRGLGVADMATAIRSGRAHRANGEMAYHVLDVMWTIYEASRDGRHIQMQSSCARPAPMAVGLPEGMLDK